MSESPAPQPTAPEPPPTRRRRVWRWFKKWTRRLLALALVLLLVFSVWYPIHRSLAYDTSERAVEEARAELAAADPGWQYEEIEAKYNASLPPPDKNSFRWIARVPELPNDDPAVTEMDGSLSFFGSDSSTDRVNRVADAKVRAYLRAARGACPEEHPAVVALVAAGTGGAPVTGTRENKSPDWEPYRLAIRAAARLGLAGHDASARGDHAAAVFYARAALGVARAVGDAPRTRARVARGACALQAVWIVQRALAWGAPKTDLTELQRELLAEAAHDRLADALRGERAVFDRLRIEPTTKAELSARRSWNQEEREPTSGDRFYHFAARPYKDRAYAAALRDATEMIAACARPVHERPETLRALRAAAFARADAAPTRYHDEWTHAFTHMHDWECANKDGQVRAQLLTTAVALACERFHQKHNKFPDALADLVPAFLAAVPRDPFDGEPLRYAPRPDGAIVYSVGPDRIDSNGYWNFNHLHEPLDICFLLWNPNARGLPHDDPEPVVPEVP